MIPAAIVAVAAVVLLGLTTRRQADLLFNPPMRARQRRLFQAIGWLLLAGSLSIALIGGDTGRRFIAWVCTVGVIALLASLSFTAIGASRRPTTRNGKRKS